MPSLSVIFPDKRDLVVRPIAFEGREAIGTAGRYVVSCQADELPAAADVLGQRCVVLVETLVGNRALTGIVTEYHRDVALESSEKWRRCRFTLESALALLELTTRTRIYQKRAIPDVVKAMLEEAGWESAQVDVRLHGQYPPRDYLVQYLETDAAFLRRICEEVGLFFYLRDVEGKEVFFLRDQSDGQDPLLPDPILVVSSGTTSAADLAATAVRRTRRRRVGKVTVRDYDFKRPALTLEGLAEAGTAEEKGVEVFDAPGGFRSAADGKTAARRLLEALRADSEAFRLACNAVGLAPGDTVDIANGAEVFGPPFQQRRLFLTAIEHLWKDFESEYAMELVAIPGEVPFRLPRVTPRPRIHGVHTAFVTGPSGSEIHPDKDGCVFVRFDWDREGPTDENSSLPVRVAQPNTPGSMLIPRVGWEVFVAFEDGDPDRPYVLGRAYNGAFPPPNPLPANKTMTSIATFSSPGGGAMNALTFDDAAGRQHVRWHAGFGMSTSVANASFVQTAAQEKQIVGAASTWSIGADDTISVTQAHIVDVGSLSTTVGAKQSLYAGGSMNVGVGSESVVVGGALLEKVGNPVTGAINLGVSAVLAGVGAAGGAIGPIAGRVAGYAAAAGGIAWGMYQAATAPGAGPNAWRDAGIRGVAGFAAGLVPGGDSVFAAASSTGVRLPWEPAPPAEGAAAAGGGAGGGASDSGAARGPGPGHRSTKVTGAMAEMIGGSHATTTPGTVKSQGLAASMVGVGGSHSSRAVTVGYKVLGISNETLGSFHVRATTNAGREITGPISTSVSGALDIESGAQFSIMGNASVTIKIGGDLKLAGSHIVFAVGDSSAIVASSGGLLVKASTITITKASKQSGTTTHK